MQIDPTHTKMLRLQYSRQLANLYKKFGKRIIPELVRMVQQYQEKYSINKSTRTITVRTITSDLDFWLDITVENSLIKPSKPIIAGNIQKAYSKGIKRANTQLHMYDLDLIEGMTPGDWEALIALQDINFNRIKDCTLNMKNAINYSCSRGVMEGWGASKVAYELRRNVTGNNNMGIVRAKAIARTEIINAYNTAAKNRFEAAGLKKSEMVWITHFDERTCEICGGYDGMSIQKTGQIPPAHTNCRCSIAPNPR